MYYQFLNLAILALAVLLQRQLRRIQHPVLLQRLNRALGDAAARHHLHLPVHRRLDRQSPDSTRNLSSSCEARKGTVEKQPLPWQPESSFPSIISMCMCRNRPTIAVHQLPLRRTHQDIKSQAGTCIKYLDVHHCYVSSPSKHNVKYHII